MAVDSCRFFARFSLVLELLAEKSSLLVVLTHGRSCCTVTCAVVPLPIGFDRLRGPSLCGGVGVGRHRNPLCRCDGGAVVTVGYGVVSCAEQDLDSPLRL